MREHAGHGVLPFVVTALGLAHQLEALVSRATARARDVRAVRGAAGDQRFPAERVTAGLLVDVALAGGSLLDAEPEGKRLGFVRVRTSRR